MENNMTNNTTTSKEIDLTIPNVGDTASIELLHWHVSEEQNFSAGDELCDLVTDKAAFSLEAPQEGRMMKILVPSPKTVAVGQTVARVQVFG